MLASRASGAFVCLRCQLRLARPTAPAVSRLPSHASFSASARRHDALDDALAGPPPRPKNKVSKHPLGKIKRRKGKTIRETTAAVDVKTLGEDSEILVLKEVDEGPRQKEEPPAPQPLPDSAESPSLLASLKEEAGEVKVTQEKVNERLDDLRPKTHDDPDEPHYLPYATFLQLHKTLTDGFTVTQLSKYFSAAQGIGRNRVGAQVLKGLKGTKKNVAGRTEWQPGTTPLATRLVGGAMTMFKRKERRFINKPMIVDQILRKVWNVVLLEEIEASGEIEISLKSWQVALLTAGASPNPLDRVGSMRRAKVEVFWPDSIVRITANKSSAEYAADDIELELKNAESKEFDLKPWQRFLGSDVLPKEKPVAFLSEKDMQIVTELSGAVIQPTSSNTYMLRGRNKSSVEEAERAIVNMLPIKSSSPPSIDTLSLRNRNPPYLLPIPSKSVLPYRLRNLDLGRWSLPVARSKAQLTPGDQNPVISVGDRGDSSTEDARARIVKALMRFPSEQQLNSSYKSVTEVAVGQATWADTPLNVLAVTFGQGLFPIPQKNAPVSAATIPSESTFPAAFSCQLPGVFKLLLDEQLTQGVSLYWPRLQYNFVISPHGQRLEPLRPGQQYPHLQIVVEARPGQDVVLSKVGIRFNRQSHQVLLPDQVADLRFEASSSLLLQNAPADERIAAWFASVRQNIESGGRLTAPESLQLDIPRWLLPGKRKSDDGTQTLTYLFTGITYQQSVSTRFNGRNLRYMSKHGGKLAEKVSRLRLFAKSKNESVKSFVKSVFELLEKITEASTNPTELRRIALPRDQMSDRKRRRMHLQGKVGATDAEELTTGDKEVLQETDWDGPMSARFNVNDMDDPQLASMLGENVANPVLRVTEEEDEEVERGRVLEQSA
ncbi:mitochondrial inner-membrane-bound regulator-domain-containing protein [Lophiotrema nucula]|uniref:Mitochondrial inner-membrane-bound regulator-domain-containing protein n=1 Tax=Lophiotrema nucula TaxID=690887 RepID=A0A6A5Z7T4_9PLEO|nr:mitochondrial inner-membrane-bound regulator-domain-containing protein [Lophiotrema nucula]